MQERKVSAQIPILDAGIVRGIEAIYEMESREWREAKGECSKLSEQVARQFGLLYVEGKFRLDEPLSFGTNKIEEEHAWCVDGGQRIIDLTATQFNKGLYNKLPSGVIITTHGEDLFNRYRPYKALKL